MRTKLFLFSMTALLLSVGCQPSEQQGTPSTSSASTPSAAGGLSDSELKLGIGPIKENIALSAIDAPLAEKGGKVFESKCGACHKMTEKYVGPALGEVLSRRTPAYILNMILNPQEMTQKHPEAKKLLAEHLTVMPFQNVSQEEARAILEYLRTQQTTK